jgi:serine/threonine-protein kinase ATR
VKGVLTRNPGWEATLAGFQVESAWMIGDWDDVTSYVGTTKVQSSAVVMARALLALRNGDASGLASSLNAARKLLGSPITAAGSQGYRRCYEAVLDLHLLHELEVIDAIAKKPEGDPFLFYELVDTLSARLDATLPAFRIREPILSMRRTAFGLRQVFQWSLTLLIDISSRTNRSQDFQDMIGRTWLASAKTARKAGHWQTAYSAMLQAQQKSTPFWFIESAKLIKVNGEPLRALHELENAIGRTAEVGAGDDAETRKMKGKVRG